MADAKNLRSLLCGIADDRGDTGPSLEGVQEDGVLGASGNRSYSCQQALFLSRSRSILPISPLKGGAAELGQGRDYRTGIIGSLRGKVEREFTEAETTPVPKKARISSHLLLQFCR